jgi:DNA-binding transcriptional ArsR family regulator
MDTNYMKYSEIAEILKVLAHPIRLCLIKSILDQGECNVSHMQTCLAVPQSTVSQHLQKLKYAGVIEGTRKGLMVIYKIRDERIVKLVNSILILS